MSAELKSRTATALAALVIGWWSTLAAAEDSCDRCTEPNGRGIYASYKEHHCFEQWLSSERIWRFCPEAFVEIPGAVTKIGLAGRLFTGSPWALVESQPEQPYELLAIYRNEAVTLVGVEATSSDSRLKFRIHDPKLKSDVTVMEADLANLTLEVKTPTTPGPYLLSFTEVNNIASPLFQYTAKWKRKGAVDAPKDLCTGVKNTMSLLPGKRVDGRSGKVTDQVNAATLSCESGAIVPCMAWGYRPSLLPLPSQEGNALLGACIQAKRAAYFLASGDIRSYTVEGKTIALKDKYHDPNDNTQDLATPNDPIEAVEAIWTEAGAQCFIAANRRAIAPPALPLPANAKELLPECPNPLPKNSEEWVKWGILVTGKVP